jgi:hypothetical protein
MAFAKLKALLRARAVRTIDALWRAIGEICDLALKSAKTTHGKHVASADKVESAVQLGARCDRRDLLGEDTLDASGAKI